jgi:hypothetical protein
MIAKKLLALSATLAFASLACNIGRLGGGEETAPPPAPGETTSPEVTESPEEPLSDECLLGTWAVDTSEVERRMVEIVSGVEGVEIVGVTGRQIAEIEEGSIRLTPEDYTVTYRLDESVLELRMEGFVTSTYVIAEENVVQSFTEEFALEIFISTPSGSIPFPLDPEEITSGPFGSEGRFSYECSETTLTVADLTGQDLGGGSTATRISEP